MGLKRATLNLHLQPQIHGRVSEERPDELARDFVPLPAGLETYMVFIVLSYVFFNLYP